MTSWKDNLTPEQIGVLSSLRHASMSIQNEVNDAYERAESKQDFVDNMTNYLEDLSAEAVGTIEEIQKLFEKEEKKKEEGNPEASEEEEKRAFVVYGKLGQPLAYIIPIEEEELTELQMSVCMEVFDAVDNAETLLRWEEIA